MIPSAVNPRLLQRHGLTIVESYEDLGNSAFKGAHASHGHLARFLASVRAGAIPSGSYLIVESLDRLSRADIPEALSQFLEIIRAGIVVVTLMDQKTYTRGSIARDISRYPDFFGDHVPSQWESRSKGKRSVAVWEAKRREALEGKVHCLGLGPAWLVFDREQSRWVADEKKAATLREIFDLYAGGLGIIGIVRKFSREKRPVIGDSDGWHAGYVRALVSNRAVLGEKVFYKMEDRKRQRRTDIDLSPTIILRLLSPLYVPKCKIFEGKSGCQR